MYTSNYRTKFEQLATGQHGSRYDYSLLPNTFTYKSVLPIICPTHGTFNQKARTHATGSGCPKCAHSVREQTTYANNRHTIEQFIEKAKLAHGNFYDYSDTVYIGQMKKLTVKCPRHGTFEVVANNHVHGTGCSACKRSRGETKIENWLILNQIIYETQKTFTDLFLPDCKKRTNKPKYDFFIPSLNLLIEFDGKHHFEPVKFNGVSDDHALRLHERTVFADRIKNTYAEENGYAIQRIHYSEFNQIETILEGVIRSYSSSSSS